MATVRRTEQAVKRTKRPVKRGRGRVRVWWHRSAKKTVVADVTASIHLLPKVLSRQKFLRWLDIFVEGNFARCNNFCAIELCLVRLTFARFDH